MKLIIGAKNNEKVVLYVNEKVVKEKTLPHPISAGRWASFWLQIRQGEVLLGFEGVPTALFEWKQKEEKEMFQPMFLSYMSEMGHPIGIFFKCDECHTENTTTNYLTRFLYRFI